ncbi:response regulator [Psychromonas algicola]|uniref:response regulator n=1 Tax=Psychromonas algicola TaxID=2555642 RepID=UPI001068C68E|nr:response regulator transcription factor [Psychromonas sp. RZ5]TEW44243.1 response regulator transcription factor [Psychromonas sp. RZ5]
MQLSKQILVVDDDQSIRELLSEYLAKASFDVISAEDGVSMAERLKESQPDLIILDVMLPGDDGFILCQRIRKTSNVPIIMLTANSDEMDRVLGLEIGADDYIAKPFSPRELLARVKALLRRSTFIQEESTAKPRFIKFADWTLDTLQHKVSRENGELLTLTGADYQLLMLLIANPNKAVSRDDICQELHGRKAFANERAIDVHLSRLRQHLGDDAKQPQIIKTVRGAGYVFIAEIEFIKTESDT